MDRESRGAGLENFLTGGAEIPIRPAIHATTALEAEVNRRGWRRTNGQKTVE